MSRDKRHLDHEHANVLGVAVSAIDMKGAVDLADNLLRTKNSGYICVTGVHGIMEAQSDPLFRDILNKAAINAPDGMPMSWVGWLQGFGDMNRVYGPDFMLEMCELSVERGYRHFFYGGQTGVAQLLSAGLQKKFAGLLVAGSYTPPFRLLDSHEERELITLVANVKPDIFWVGLSTPKQERFMSAFLTRLNVPLMVGVGAAFDIHTGRSKDAPAWMKSFGLQWLHRLLQEPRRLGRRYLVNNPVFIMKISRQLLSERWERSKGQVS